MQSHTCTWRRLQAIQGDRTIIQNRVETSGEMKGIGGGCWSKLPKCWKYVPKWRKNMTVWWCNSHLENMSSSMGRMATHILWKIKNVWNQPGINMVICHTLARQRRDRFLVLCEFPPSPTYSDNHQANSNKSLSPNMPQLSKMVNKNRDLQEVCGQYDCFCVVCVNPNDETWYLCQFNPYVLHLHPLTGWFS